MSDMALRNKGMDILQKGLGDIEAERFITLIIHDNFDYTEWRKDNLDDSADIRNLSQAASDYFAKKHPDLS